MYFSVCYAWSTYQDTKECLQNIGTFTRQVVKVLCLLLIQKLCRLIYAMWPSKNYLRCTYWRNIIWSYLLYALFYRFLYRILTDATIQSNKSKIIILCNKQDKLMAKGSGVIKALLEKELYVFYSTYNVLTCFGIFLWWIIVF